MPQDSRRQPLLPSRYYHIFNRGQNGDDLFFEPRNYAFFLSKLAQYVAPFVEILAYCLLKNHFHLLVQVKEEEPIWAATNGKSSGTAVERLVSNGFSSFLQSYAQAINKAYGRTGNLFELAFQRKRVADDAYLTQLIWYIHYNPQKHGLLSDFREYPHSSYKSHLSTKPTRLSRNTVLEWFGGRKGYYDFHNAQREGIMLQDVWME